MTNIKGLLGIEDEAPTGALVTIEPLVMEVVDVVGVMDEVVVEGILNSSLRARSLRLQRTSGRGQRTPPVYPGIWNISVYDSNSLSVTKT